MAERPLYTLYKNLKAQNYDVPNDYDKFESALTRDGKSGADNRHAIYENLKAQNFDVPDTYERFYSALFEPRSKTSSRAKGGSVPMSAADRARFSAGAAAISASAQQTMNNVGRYNRLKQRKQKQQKDFGRVNLGTHKTAFGGDANNVVKDDFAYNPETGKAGAYVTSDNDNAYTQNEAEQKQAILDEQNNSYQQAVDTGEIPSVLDVRDKNGNYDLQENIGKNGTYLTEEGAQRQFDKKLADAYARKKEIEALIAEDNRQHGNPLLSYGASIGAGNGRTAQQSDYRNKLATSLSLVTEQIGALEAVKQYPTSSWGEDALKALDNTVFTAKTWDFGLTDFATMGQMERIKTKMDNNIPLSGSDNILLKSKLGADAAAALEDEKMGNIYRWTKIAGQSLPFMADFFLTGGYGGITKGISSGALKIAAKRGMGKVSAAILKNTGIVAGDIIGSYAMAGTEQAMKTGADIMQRHLGNLYQDEKGDYKFGTFDENGNLLHEGGESIGTALYKGLTSAMVENYTEKLFGHNYGIKKGAIAAMEKHGMDGTAQFFKNIGKSGWYTNSKKWMEKFGINGFGEEVMEEEIGIPLHALLDGDNNFSDLGDAKQQLDIIGGMAISVGSMYAMGAGSRPIKGIYNRAQYYRFRNKVNVADNDAQSLFGDNWADIKDKIDNATNEQMGGVLADILRQRDTMNKEQINAAVNYGVNLMKMRGYNIAKTAEMNAKEIANEPTTPEEQHQADIDNAYSEGHDADDADKHNIQLEQNDKANELAAMLHVTPEQLHDMADEDLEAMTGQNDKLDQAIYDYQVSTAKYQGVMDGAQDEVDMAAHQAAMETDNMTDLSRGTVRKATFKATGGLEDYEVYIISGNIATHDDGSIDVGNSDDMIIYYDPTTGRKEHADAMMFADLIEELPAADVKAQAINDAKENAIKKIAGIIDGTVEVGSQFSVTDADGTEHTYEVLADNGDGTAMITIDGSVPTELVKGENVQIPYSFADLQQMKDMEDQKRLETAKAEREQIEKERAAKQTQETEETQSSFDFNQILNDDGNVVLVDVLDEDGNTKYPNSKLFLIRDTGAKAKVVELKSDGTIVPHAVNKEDVATISSMSLDEYKKAMPESSMIEDNSGENRGEIEVETPTIEGETAAPAEETAAPESAETPATEQTPAMTLEDGTEVPMLEDGNPDFSKLTAEQTAELYDSQFGEDADSIVSGYVSDAKKALDKANSMTVKGKTFVEQKAAKQAKEKAIADAQAAYDSAIAIRDAYNERQLAKVEDTAEGRKELIEKARRKFARLKSAVKDDAEAVAQIYKETVGTLLHRLYDGTGIDVTDTIPLTAEEYVASNLGAHTLNYEGTETSKGVKQETGLSREDFAKTQLLAADGKGTTVDNLVHSLWENRPSNLESLDTQEIRNTLIDVLTSGFKASEARNYIENLRIAQAENILEEQKKAAENAAYAEEQKAKQEEEKAEEKTHSEAFNKIVDLAKKQEEILDNPDNVKEFDKINREIDELLKTLSDEEFKEVSDALLNIDEDFEYLTADEYERREGVEESKKANAYNESLQQTIKQIAPYSDALKAAVKSGDKKAIAKAQKELTDALLASTLGHGYLSSQLAQAKMAKKKDETYSENRAFIKPLTDAINAIESALDSAIADAGLEGVHVDFKDNGHGWIYADKGSEWSSRLKPLDNNYRNVSQYDGVNPASVLPQITMDNVEKVAGIIKSRIEEGERYNSDEYNDEENEKINDNINENINSPEQTKFPDKLREGSDTIEVPEDATDDKPLGKQLSKDKVPFKVEGKNSGEMYDINDNEDRQRLINDNKVDDKDILDIDMPEHVHKAIKELCKKMGLKVQFLYMGANLNGWVENGTMYLALDAKNAIQCVFGHEMTHAIKQKNPEAYKELVKVALAVTTKKEFEEDLAKVYQSYHGYKGYNNVDDFVEEVVADNIGKFINDYDLAKKFSLRLNHPVLATILHAIQKIKSLLYGDFYKSVDALERIVEKAYVDTAKGEITNSETGEDVSFSLRQKPEPKKKGIGYKVFVLKDGKLYPPMVANPNGAATPVGVWLDADAAPIAGESKTGRPQVKQGGKGTQGGSGKLAYRPGWHLGVVPYAIQFNRKDAEGNKTLFPKNFVFAEVEYAADVDYQEEARQEGINPSGKYQHSLAGLKHLPTDGYYMYRTNPNPETDPWVITGAMKVNRILTRAEQAELVKNAGREPQQIQEGDIVTDDVVDSINQEIADAPKFSIKTYHGSQASFDKFDHSFMGSGEGAQAYGWGTYVSEVEGIAKAYAKANAKKNAPSRLMYQGKPMTYKTPSIIYQVALDMDKFNISAKEAISKMIDADEKKLASVGDTPFAKMKAKQVQDELKVLKDLNPSDFKINEDYDTVAQDLIDTKSGLDLLEDELKDAKSYVDLYQSRLDEAKEELSKAKESGTGLGVDMYESDVEYYSEQVKRYKQSIKTKESDIKDVKNKVDALQKKLDSMEKPRNLYSVDIPDDTGDNYLGWDEPLNAKQIDMWKKALLSAVPESDRAYYKEWADGMLENRKKENNPLTGKDAYYAIDSKYASKKTSMALSKAGFVGVKVIAQRNTGGNKEGKMNYVIFDENNAQITSHTKFSLKKDGLTPEIANTPVNIVDADEEHGFKNYAEAREWAKKNIVRTYNDEETGGKGEINISNTAVGKYLSEKAIDKSISKDVHMSVLKVLPSVLRESVDAYQHGDRKKVNNVRSEKFGINPDVMIHRCFGAVNIGGKVYGVKITLKENVKTRENKKLYSYEATKIELLDGKNEGVTMTPSLNSNNSITVAKIAKVFETAKKNGEKFSLKDEKTLAGVHNITEEKLRKALKLGGFANPSLAVIDTNKTGHDNFGEISFIAPSALLDKRTGNTGGTWITDAYTQRYPSIEREMSEKGSQKFKDWVDSLEYPSEAKAEIKRQAEDALSNNNAPAWELMYLKEKGIDIKEYDSRIDYRWKEIISDHPTAEDILNSMKTDPELNEKVTSLAKHAIIHPTWEKVSLEVRRKMYKETGVKASPINPQVRKQTKEIFERDYAPTLLNKDGSPRKKDVKKVVEDIVKEHNDTKKYDFYLSKVKASNYVNKNGLYDDYIRWQENKLDEFGTKNRIFRGYTKDGSRKYVPETLENVSKAMREEADGQTNGSEYTSFGSFIAKLASRVDSTDEMRANKDKLSSNKDKEEFYEKWNGVYYDLAKFLYNDVFYGEQRLHDIVLQSDPKKYAKKEYGITLTPTFMKKLDALKNAVQTELKSAYFETKYNRPLRLNEFAAAVVPNNLGDDVRKGISDAGLPMYDYDPKKDGDRSRAFNEAINSSDNIRFSLKDEKEKIVADAKANGTYMIAPNGEKTKLDAEQWATVRTTNFKNWFGDWENDPENASKVVDENGEPLVAYHGTTNDETTSVWNEKTKMYDTSHEPFTVFKREVDGLPNSGLFFNSSEDNAYEYGYNNYAVYLSAKNPLVIDCKGSLYNSIKHDGKTMDTYDWANWAEENGYDGVIFKNIKDGVDYGSMQDTTDDYVVFKSNQIKSAENNNGDFSADNNDIRFSLKSMMAKPEGWKQANKKAIHIAEAIERDPKFSLKNLDGTLIKAGTYFSGGGLVEEGLKGIIDPVVAVEYDEKISGVYRNNFGQHIVTADVRDVDPKDLVKQIDGEVEYFHASPVCKNYSQAKNNHAEVELDKETAASTAEFINAVKPKVVTIENVKGYKDSDAMKTITDALDANGYTWDADVYNAADFGGYTNRERLIVRAVRDGKLPAKPKKMEHKSGWYEAVADIIPTLTEKKNGVANWMDVRLKADGIDWRNIDKPLYVMGSAYADGKIPHAFADELLPTLRTKSGDVIVMPDGKVYRAMGRVLARVSGVSDDYKMPFSESLSHTIIGNGIPTQLTEHVIAPLVQNTLRPTPEDGNTKFSLRGSTPYDKQMEEWMEKNHLEKGAVPMEKPIMKEGENIFDYANRMVEWTRNQNLWKTAPKQTGFQDALDKWKADNGLSPDAYPPVRPHREYYSSEIGYSEDLEEYNKKKVLWKSAPKPKDFDLSVDLEDMNKQLRNIRRAVLNQKNYDQRTVKAVSDLVRKMLNIGWGDGLSRGKVGNLLSAAKNATGANDVKKYLDKAMGILAENYLNRLSTAYDNLINTKGARADQSGVIKMGSLDAKGQAFMSEYKKAINMDDKSLNNYIANIEEDSAKNEDNVEMNDYRLAGIQAAIMYKQQIGGNDADISELKRQIDELKNKKDATKEDKDLLKSLEKKLFENKFDRITMYENLLNNIQRMVKESKGRAKEFREEIAEHKNEILYRANLDLEGVDSTYYDTTTAKKKLVNNDLQRAVFSSTYTFEQFLKFFGKKAANGEGRLYNYFTKLNQDALDEEQLYNEMNRNALDEKTKELFGKNKFMNLVGIDGKDMKEMDVEVTDYSNKETGKRTIHLKQGQMLYIYLVNKETDGEMKLRAMGITEEDVAAIEENLDPRVKAMGEWLQDEYLPECQRRYQATHTKYFGAPMKEVENYFPLAINNRARNVKEDVNQDSDAISQLAGTSTGAIVTRRVNVIPLDIENADAFEVAFNHLQEMEEWSAMLPFRQDINTLLSYTHFRNQVQNMSSVAYGSGKTLWDEFKQTAQIAAGTYKPKVNAGMMDSRIAAAMGGIAVAKISGRLWTAIKQSQSATVFLPECDFTRFVKNGVNPYGSWKWAMENIPDFRKRVENMTYGDVKLRQYLDELEKWHDWTKTISKIGMAPNILVDGITCAVGARSVYETEVNRLTKLGYPKEKAEEKAYYKAVAAYNKTQQSSGGMYLSPMQVDRTYVSAALSLFKNANYAYGRMQIEACRGLARTYDFWGGKHKTTLIESMTRQIMEEDGLDENTARAIAKATYNRTFRQSIGRLINFATLVPVSWALYKVLPYLLTGDDDDKKNDMIEEAVLKGFATSLSDNYVIPFASNILNAGLKVEDGKPTFDPEVFRYQNLYINPATSDLANIYSMVGNQKWYSVANKLGMLGVQSLIGFNPETVGALYQAFAEADYDNGNTAKEWQIGILKAISAPEESIRELYMDELGLKSGDIKKIPLAELEKRYAERQINRDNLLSQIGMDAETFNGYVDKYQKSFEKKIKDKMDKWDEYNKKKADEFFDTTSDPKLKDMIEKKRAKDANAAADEQIAKEGLNQEKKGKEPSEEAYDAVKMSIDVAEDNAISTYNKVLNKRYAALNDEYNNQTDAMKYIFMSKHPNFKAYKDLESEYTTYGKKMKELKEKLVSADGYDAKQTILKQIRAEREKFSELQSKVR